MWEIGNHMSHFFMKRKHYKGSKNKTLFSHLFKQPINLLPIQTTAPRRKEASSDFWMGKVVVGEGEGRT
jgi:hypothetical protein